MGWGEISQLRFRAVSKCFAVILPCFNSTYLQVSVAFNPTSKGLPLLSSNRDFVIYLHLGWVPLQILLIPSVY